MRDTKVVLVKDIVEEPLGKDDPAVNPKPDGFIRELGESIRMHGVLHPPVLIPHPDQEGKLLIVVGRGRLRAVRDYLKEESIVATIDMEMTRDEAYAATIAENVFRTEMKSGKNKARYFKAVQVWWKFHKDRTTPKATEAETKAEDIDPATIPITTSTPIEQDEPESFGAKLAPNQECSQAGEQEQPQESQDATEEALSGEARRLANLGAKPLTEAEKGFVDSLSEGTGVSKRSAMRTLQIAKAFTPEQLDVFELREAPQKDMETLAGVTEEHRAAAFALWATGMPASEAAVKALPKEGPRPDAALSDEGWIEKWCPALLGRLRAEKNASQFEASAKLYRHVRESMNVFRNAIRKEVLGITVGGRFTALMSQVVRVSHPKDWLLCSACAGSGKQGSGPCLKCGQGGFLLKLDKE